jgi:hypothetical protein
MVDQIHPVRIYMKVKICQQSNPATQYHRKETKYIRESDNGQEQEKEKRAKYLTVENPFFVY